MNDKEFKALEEKYYAELRKREKINTLKRRLKSIEDTFKSFCIAKDSPYHSIGGLQLEGYISCSDCEGRNEISRDKFSLELEADEVVELFNRRIEALKESIEDLTYAVENDDIR